MSTTAASAPERFATVPPGHELLRQIFELSHDAILVADPERDVVVDANPRASALLGYTREDLRTLPLSAIHPTDLQRLRQLADPAAEPGGVIAELTCRTRVGRPLAVEVSCSRLEVDGRPYLLCLLREIPERRRAAEAQARAHERTRRQLAAAARIQESLLPAQRPRLPGLRTAWVFRPCEELAGDNLGIFPLDGGRVGLYVLDVSGHGVAAALLASVAQRFLSPAATRDSVLRAGSGRGGRVVERPARVAERLNRRLRPHLLPSQYLTLLYGVLDLNSHRFQFASAGHWGPVLVPAGGPARLLHARGFPIGVMEDVTYEEHEERLRPGDRLYLYSDGIPESESPRGEQFDWMRIAGTLERLRERPLEDTVPRLVRSVQRWHGSPRLEDDVSVLALEIEPEAAALSLPRPPREAPKVRVRAAGG